jgi:hypothetical protein
MYHVARVKWNDWCRQTLETTQSLADGRHVMLVDGLAKKSWGLLIVQFEAMKAASDSYISLSA